MSDESRFTDALAISDPAERAAFLDRACSGNSEQRRRIDELLAAHLLANSFLARPAGSPDGTATHDPAVTRTASGHNTVGEIGDCIGPYKLLEKIGEGGMGEVWVADQFEPIKRRIAIKLIKPGMDSRSVLGRFEAERQALAVMDHPNISKVFDAGSTADGRPYFVMELVKGTPITEFCDARKLTPRQRLELFIPVCNAIQHAHMKGIIHRDIKPSNVMVALHDETPVPKVIDFGVAKAVGQQFTEKTIYTGFGALVGTPAYMAPEQATFNQLDVDTRADVYALGVLLYELLAGSPPIEVERLKKSALDEVLRIVRDEEPPRPSQRLSTSQAKASIAATRGSEPAKLSALMKGEIDWIVMKALEKDRTRRYDTANGLAKDVRRYLSGDTVEACPPTLGYRLRKAYRRYRVAVVTSGAFLLVLVAATVVSLIHATRATLAERDAIRHGLRAEGARRGEIEQREVAQREAEKAMAARDQAVKDRTRAEEGEKKAKQAAQETQSVMMFFRNTVLFGELRTNKRVALPDSTIGELIRGAGPMIPEFFKGVPLAEADVHSLFGMTHLIWGEYGEACGHLEKAFALSSAAVGPDDPKTLEIQYHLGEAQLYAGAIESAIRNFESPASSKKSGVRWISGVRLADAYERVGRYQDAIPRREAAVAASRKPDHKYSLTSSLLNLGRCLISAGRTDDAERVLRESLSTLSADSKGSPIWHDVTISLGTCLLHRKQYADAEAAYLSSLKRPEGWVWIETFDHRSRATEAYEGLLSIYSVTGQLEKAKELRKTRPPEIAPKPRIVR